MTRRLVALRNTVNPWVPLAALALILLLAALSVWHLVSRDAVPVGQYLPATPAPAVAKVATAPVAIKSGTVTTYKPAAKARLKLPPAIQAAPEQQVIAANTVQPDSHAYTLTTLINTDTGEVQHAAALPDFAQHGRCDRQPPCPAL